MTESDNAARRRELDDELRRSAWAEQDSFYAQANDMLVESGAKALQAALWLNGGAVVVVLGFLASLITKGNGESDLIYKGEISFALKCFAFGALASAVAGATSYLTNYCYLSVSSSRIRQLEHPYLIDSRSTKWWQGFGYAFHAISIFLPIASYVLFLIGALKMTGAVKW
jgi:hypothetical protein